MLKRRRYTEDMGINTASMKYQFKSLSILWLQCTRIVLVGNSRKDAIARLPTQVWRTNKIQSRAWSNCTCKGFICRTVQSDWRSSSVNRLYPVYTKNHDQLAKQVHKALRRRTTFYLNQTGPIYTKLKIKWSSVRWTNVKCVFCWEQHNANCVK